MVGKFVVLSRGKLAAGPRLVFLLGTRSMKYSSTCHSRNSLNINFNLLLTNSCKTAINNV